MTSFISKTMLLSVVLTHIDSFSLFPATAIDFTLKSTPATNAESKSHLCVYAYLL